MSAVPALREKLGEDAMAGLHVVLGDSGRQWKNEVLTIAGERFEKRLSQEIGTLRVDMAKEFAALRTDTAKDAAALRVDIARELAAVRIDTANECAAARSELSRGLANVVKWSFLFWIGQFAAVSAMMAFLLRTIGRT